MEDNNKKDEIREVEKQTNSEQKNNYEQKNVIDEKSKNITNTIIFLIVILIIIIIVIIDSVVLDKKEKSLEQENQSLQSGEYEKVELEIIAGEIVDINLDTKTIRIKNDDESDGSSSTIQIDEQTLINTRTAKSIALSDVNVGDYYYSYNNSILRNVTSKELIQELKENMALTDYDIYVAENELLGVEEKEDGTCIYHVRVTDPNTQYFGAIQSYEMLFLVDDNTVLDGNSNENSSILTYQTESFGKSLIIRLDSETLEDTYPYVISINSYDKISSEDTEEIEDANNGIEQNNIIEETQVE